MDITNPTDCSRAQDSAGGDDKVGQALNANRFQMLEDIARELASEVVFPTYFDAAFRLRRELQDPLLPTARIASIVSVEPLVATKLIHLANSVYYRRHGGQQANDLKAAINRLGSDLVRTTALAVAMGQLLRSKDLVVFSDLTHTLWAHSIKAAAAARILARSRTKLNPDEALLAGLVHDLGAFYMLYRAVQYPELRARPDTVKYLIMQWHESIGVTLLNALGMPDEIVQATIDHDQPRCAPIPMRTLADIVYLSNIIAGRHFEWSQQAPEAGHDELTMVRGHVAELLPEIDVATLEMQAVFS